MLSEVCGKECVSHACMLEWHRRFSDGQEHDERCGHQYTSRTRENIQKIQEINENDRQLGIRAIAQTFFIDREMRKILHENLCKGCPKSSDP